MSIISLLSDFGLKDPYVAEMKGVILSISPHAIIVDISHEIDKFNIRMGAFILASAAPYFPKKTVHVAVVDPGVGTKRLPIIVETNRSFYVGPDNGLLILAAQKESIINVYQITNQKYTLYSLSNTFHGRDIFAPIAAYLAKGLKPSSFGHLINDYVVPNYSKSTIKNCELTGEVLQIDDFGNIISNISIEDFSTSEIHEGELLSVKIGNKTLNLYFYSAYGEAKIGTPLVLFNSSSFLEISVNQGKASKLFKTKVGDSVKVSRITKS